MLSIQSLKSFLITYHNLCFYWQTILFSLACGNTVGTFFSFFFPAVNILQTCNIFHTCTCTFSFFFLNNKHLMQHMKVGKTNVPSGSCSLLNIVCSQLAEGSRGLHRMVGLCLIQCLCLVSSMCWA